VNEYPLVWLIIGVSGSGKTTVGRLLSQKLECDFLEGDRRHPMTNIQKMISQQPLQDEDRLPWLLEIENDIRRAIDRNREIVITCSALKAAYRKQLTSWGRVQLVWLDVDMSSLEQRLKERPAHYMKPAMLAGQLSVFELPASAENIITINGNQPIDIVVSELMKKAVRQYSSMEKNWWERCL
jgi:gluconokinase